ncbi:ArsR family transcriptional regulator [Hoeflea marina]|uniref:ArsR family transcriptional regulator n=1 Tax=Hoeflea marina TaxID=274592 RepID=A0A317PE46_9HYPH|nr:helix-turn-helix transcriptional regulator [Hoeflea marina]PWV97660.1 ArsR family transcriptional regulator [Hoeflea marina]
MLDHPAVEDIDLTTILAALGDPIRLAILGDLARSTGTALCCADFRELTSKSNLTYHIARMREAGIVHVEPSGTRRLISLRRADIDSRFPGVLDAIIANAIALPSPFGPEGCGLQ